MSRSEAENWGFCAGFLCFAILLAVVVPTSLHLWDLKQAKAKHNTAWKHRYATIEIVGVLDYGDVAIQVSYPDLQGHTQRTSFDYGYSKGNPHRGQHIDTWISTLKEDQKHTHVWFEGAINYPITNPFRPDPDKSFYPVWSIFVAVFGGLIVSLIVGLTIRDYLYRRPRIHWRRRSPNLFGMKTQSRPTYKLVHKSDGSLTEETVWR